MPAAFLMRLAQGSAQQSSGVQRVARGHGLHPVRRQRRARSGSTLQRRFRRVLQRLVLIGLVQSAAGKYIHVGQKSRTRPALAHEHLELRALAPVNQQAGRITRTHGTGRLGRSVGGRILHSSFHERSLLKRYSALRKDIHLLACAGSLGHMIENTALIGRLAHLRCRAA